MVTRFFLNISHEKMSTLAHFVSHCAILLDGKSTAVYRQGISSFLQRRKHHYLVHDKTHANQQGVNVRVQFYSSVCKMDKVGKKMVSKRSCCIIQLFLCYVAICHNDGVTLWIKS